MEVVKFVKRHWAPLLAAGLIPLLIILAALQLSWIRDISEREGFRLSQGLLAAAGQLAGGFQNEIAILPSIFRLETNDFKLGLITDDWSDFQDRWELWKSYSLEPQLLSGIHVFQEKTEFSEAAIWTWDGEGFKAEIALELLEVLNKLSEKRHRMVADTAPEELNADEEAFLIRLSPPDAYWLVVVISRVALVENLIPLMAQRYIFGKSDYLFRIVDRQLAKTIYLSDEKIDEAVFNEVDLSFPLLGSDFRLINTRNGSRLTGQVNDEEESPILAPALGILKTRHESFTAFINPDLRAEVFFGQEPVPFDERHRTRWVLEAVHRKGSLAAAIKFSMFRSMAISLGILLVLGTALVFLAFSTRRTQELAERQSEFIASVTHELKTPIAVIRSAADNLADGLIRDANKAVQYGSIIRGESRRLNDLIDRLLIYARIGDSQPCDIQSFDLGELCQQVLDQHRQKLEAAKFRVEAQIKPDIIVKGDPTAIELAISNIINNALKHAREGAFLGLDLRPEGRSRHNLAIFNHTRAWALLSIRDRGPGIPRREHRLVMEAFYRGERAKLQQSPGSGLGLNIVKRIIQAHGGQLAIEMQGSLGTAFVIRLPLGANNEPS